MLSSSSWNSHDQKCWIIFYIYIMIYIYFCFYRNGREKFGWVSLTLSSLITVQIKLNEDAVDWSFSWNVLFMRNGHEIDLARICTNCSSSFSFLKSPTLSQRRVMGCCLPPSGLANNSTMLWPDSLTKVWRKMTRALRHWICSGLSLEKYLEFHKKKITIIQKFYTISWWWWHLWDTEKYIKYSS